MFVLDSTNMVFFMSPLALTLLLPVAVLWELPTYALHVHTPEASLSCRPQSSFFLCRLFRTWLPNATLGAGCVLMFSGLSALLLSTFSPCSWCDVYS